MEFFEHLGTKVILGLFAMPGLHSGPCCSTSVCANGLSPKTCSILGPKGQEGGLDDLGQVRAVWRWVGTSFAQLEAFPAGCVNNKQGGVVTHV